MFGLEALDVLIGLATVYLAFGVACTAAVEAVSAWLKVRSTNLEAALEEFLAGDCKQNQETEPFVKAFYDHPLVQALTKDKNGRPSYIPPEIVGQVVEAVVTANGTVTSLVDAVDNLPDGRIKSLLKIFITQAGGNAAAFRKAVEDHFNAAMDRASGCFKRHTQKWALIISAAFVIGANADTVALTNSLASDPAARARMVEVAQLHLTAVTISAKTTEDLMRAGQTEGDLTVEQAKKQVAMARTALDRAVSDLESTGIQIGWQDLPSTFSEWLTKFFGLLVSIFAVSLGAPFWFDVLQGFMRVRTTGVAPREK
jgi:hypothetical protein